MRQLLVVLLTAVLAAVTGCSGSKTSAAPARQPTAAMAAAASTPLSNPCNLLTPAEASAAVGQTLLRSDVQHYGPVTRCRFFNGAGDEPLWLDVSDAATFEGLAHLPDAHPVAGIGDRALWQHDELATFLYILKGGNMISMGLPRTLTTLTPAVRKTAKLVADRM